MERISGSGARGLMAIDFAHYVGREPAYVKHTFLDKYLPALIGRVASWCDTFVYVDGFAGPWKSVAGEKFADTSFGIALGHMTAQKILYARRGRDVKMKAFLVEKDQHTFTALEQAVATYPKIDAVPLMGEMEDHVLSISASIPAKAFSFVLIDPKGFPLVERIMPLIRRSQSEALVNFMFDFANRFAGTTLIPALEQWLSSNGDENWRGQVDKLAGREREEKLEELAVEKLREQAGYTYSPVISVDKALHDRTLYKLIFLTRHDAGLQVFRDSQHAALEAQAKSRTKAKADARTTKSGMSGLFDESCDIPFDRSSIKLREGEELARSKLLDALRRTGEHGAQWKDVWPAILETTVVTRSKLGRFTNDLRKSGIILAPGWPSERHLIPADDQVLRFNHA
jgi:three-Cys-motif partner protein